MADLYSNSKRGTQQCAMGFRDRRKFMSQLSYIVISTVMLFGLSACAVSYMDNKRMIYSPSFVEHSEQINIEIPTFAILDKHYEIVAGNYQVTNVDTGHSSGETTRIDSEVKLNVFNSVLTNQDWLVESERYAVDLERSFSFDLSNARNAYTDSSHCDLRHLYQKEEKSRIFRDEEPQSESTRPVSSLLACEIGDETDTWQLYLAQKQGSETKLVLRARDLMLRIEPEYSYQGERVNLSGEVLDTRRHRGRTIVGLRIYDENQEIATLFLPNKKEVLRINTTISQRQQQRLFAVLYNFVIVDKIHSIWNR